ncbi:endonuclease domain-containing protein [Amycolatopsis sp. WQ 127309]|uniref:endonuclease domain-containing protein n=1 Tax=Amycolatopsis sp. WQ 127309 TaxID=2932773 RepID=UPI001FF139A3|nr:very short patch repair endonuclease [Amycolatopsis sp. WQ 127309]UOZ08907.1 very short patch repair endonuclease [Amycolatopsis sp. WQ 127309]
MFQRRSRDLVDFAEPFIGSHAVAEDALTLCDLRSPSFTRLFRNVYVASTTEVTHSMRCRAAALFAPSGAVLTGCSAAAVRGLELVGPQDLVEFVVPEKLKFNRQAGLHIRRTSRMIDSEPWGDIQLATPLRLALDVTTNTKLHRSLPRTVGYLDAFLGSGLVNPAELRLYLLPRRDNGMVRARKAVALADARSESLPESELRVWLTVAGLKPEVQVDVVTGAGDFLGRLDLAFPARKLAVEYDGEWHLDGIQPRLDAQRRAAIEAEGWRFVIVTKADLYGDPKRVVATVRAALSL